MRQVSENARSMPASLPASRPVHEVQTQVQARAQTSEVAVPTYARQEHAVESTVTRALGAELVPEVPARARSPVPRRKPPQVEHVPKADRREEEAWALVPPQHEPEPINASSVSAPSVSHLSRSSRNHSSSRKRTRPTRRRTEEESDYAAQEGMPQESVTPPVQAAVVADIELLPPVVSPPPLTVYDPVPRCLSPPPRNASLQSINQRQYTPSPEPRRAERIPNNHSQRHLAAPSPEPPRHVEQYGYQKTDPMASPSLPARSLSPTRQAQSAFKHAKGRQHGQHKHVPTAEVTQVCLRVLLMA